MNLKHLLLFFGVLAAGVFLINIEYVPALLIASSPLSDRRGGMMQSARKLASVGLLRLQTLSASLDNLPDGMAGSDYGGEVRRLHAVACGAARRQHAAIGRVLQSVDRYAHGSMARPVKLTMSESAISSSRFSRRFHAGRRIIFTEGPRRMSS